LWNPLSVPSLLEHIKGNALFPINSYRTLYNILIEFNDCFEVKLYNYEPFMRMLFVNINDFVEVSSYQNISIDGFSDSFNSEKMRLVINAERVSSGDNEGMYANSLYDMFNKTFDIIWEIEDNNITLQEWVEHGKLNILENLRKI